LLSFILFYLVLIFILVEATNAGPGNLEVIVNNGKVASTPQALGPSLYAITFVPNEIKDHHIDIKFNGEMVPGMLMQLEKRGKQLFNSLINDLFF